MAELQTTLTLYKNEGETPLECLDRLRVEHPEYKDAVLSYAGRLDPMAEGLLLVLVGEENKKREQYLGLDKVYEVDVLLGIGTDTGDILGKITGEKFGMPNEMPKKEFGQPNFLAEFIGPFAQKYPHYSSKPVNGKPLFEWAREGKLGEIEIPERTSEIYDIKFIESLSLSGKEILERVKERISKVSGDFRQADVIESWDAVLTSHLSESFPVYRIEVSCSSGTYMRTLAEEIAKKAGASGLAWRIKRTQIGKGSFPQV